MFNHKKFYFLFSIFYFLFLLLPFLSFAAASPPALFPTGYWGPLVSCSGAVVIPNPNYDPSRPILAINPQYIPNPARVCTDLCDLVETFLRVIYFGMSIAVFILTPIFFAWGGIMILVAGGDPGKLGEGKKILTGTLVGILIVLGAFLIVSTFIKFLGVSGFVKGFDSSTGSFTCQVQ